MNSQAPKQPRCNPRVSKLILVAAVAITVIYVLTEHRMHVVLVLPYLLLLICPLMHLFMHRGHRRHHRDEQHASSPPHEASRSGQSSGSGR